MRSIQMSASATGNNKASFTFQQPARVRSVRIFGLFVPTALAHSFKAELSKSPVAGFMDNLGLANQSIAQIAAGCQTANQTIGLNSQTMVDVRIAANETIYVNCEFDATAEFSVFVDID